MENAEVHVERGTEQLQRAAYYQVGQQHLLSLMPPFAYRLFLVLLSVPAKVPQKDVCSCCGVFHCSGYTEYHYLESVQLSASTFIMCEDTNGHS